MAGITSGSPQTDYSLQPQIAVAGQLYKYSVSDELVDYVASVAISPGQLCEVVAATSGSASQEDTCRPAQSVSGTLLPLAGVAIYKDPRAPALGFTFPGGGGVFNPGDRVPLLRRGRIYANWTGAASGQGSLIGVNYEHSTATGPQGYFTVAATSATTGAEVDIATGCRLLRSIGSTTLCLVEVNLPGALSVAGP